METRKGRGALSNREGRFERFDSEVFDDEWPGDGEDGDRPRLATTVASDASKSIISTNRSPDVPFNRSINPYRGCEHGCIYCFARPTHAYLGLSPGLDFETKLFAKNDAALLLERALRKPNYKCELLALGANTDPYQPIERERRITRSVLEILSAYNHPVGIVTKGASIVRDLDILGDMAVRGLVTVCVSVTTLDLDLARIMEPRASAPRRRMEAIRALSDAGVPTAVLTAPIIPAINDHEIERILKAAAEAGAIGAGATFIRLPLEIEGLFVEWLRAHFPDRADRVLGLIRQSRGGRLNRSDFGKRMRGEGPYAEAIAARHKIARRKHGLETRPERMSARSDLFRVPETPILDRDRRQFSLF